MSDVIRVLMVISNLKTADGVARFAMTYYSHLDHKNLLMDFAIYDSEEINEEYEKQIQKNHSKLFALPPVKDIQKHVLYCRRIFEDRHYDIVHDNTLINTIPLMKEALKAKVPVRILHAHATKLGETKYKELRNKLFLPSLKQTINTNSACSKAAAKCMFGKEDYTLIPNVIHGKDFFLDLQKRNELREKNHVSKNKVVLTVGRVADQKNPFFAIDVIAAAIRKDKEIIYWWIGDGPLLKEMREYVSDLKLDNHIRFLGNRTNISAYYMAADCFFLPSIFEGLPVSGVEAQASGIPCIFSDTITRELVYTDRVQFLSLDESVQIWSDKLIGYLNQEVDRNKVIRDFYKSPFSDANAGMHLEAFYKKCLWKSYE